MTRVKVLGIGSPFGDDQAGWRVAELLHSKLAGTSEVIIESHDRPGVRLIELMKGAERVFLIDAVQSGGEVGTIHRLHNNDIYELNTLLSTHDMGVAQAIELGRSLGDLPPDIILYGIEVGEVAMDSNVSVTVALAVEEVVDKIRGEL